MLRDAKRYNLLSRALAEASDENGDARESYSDSGAVSMTVYPLSSKEAAETYGKVNGDMLIGLAKTSKTIGIGDILSAPYTSGTIREDFPSTWSEASAEQWEDIEGYPWNTSGITRYKVVGCTKYAVGAYQLDLWRA